MEEHEMEEHEEAASLRESRFGQLPARVMPEDRVEQVETVDRRDVPEPAGDPDKWFIYYAGP